MLLVIAPAGEIRCIYAEALDLSPLGPLAITRASHAEPDAKGRWWADLAEVHGPRLGPYPHRSAALEAEQAWLAGHLAVGS